VRRFQKTVLSKNAESKRVGLARALSKLGFCSRTNAAELIRAGNVRLNGAVRRDPETPVQIEKDRIEVDGKRIGVAEKIYIILNKPRGIVTTASDEKGRETVYDLLDRNSKWLAPVGRLDKASEGLLLLTNNSEWAARITDPETHLDKTYRVQIGAIANDVLLQKLENGVTTSDGEFLSAKRVKILRGGEKNSWIDIILDEGKNRQIRKMLEYFGIEVLRLIRIAIGPLALGDLAKGKHRALTAEEKNLIDRAMRQ
jgi:23S rRNA pseudouridine2605 synthase